MIFLGNSVGGIRRNVMLALIVLTALARPAVAADEEEAPLVGEVSRQQIEMAMPEWLITMVEAAPDPSAAESLATAMSGAEITVYFGTWCSDSGRELPRLWRALDEVGVLDPPEIRYIGVGRDKTAPDGLTDEADLLLVPTFVVHRQGRELGRVVEVSPNGIERDLDALLRGRAVGTITASQDPILDQEHP